MWNHHTAQYLPLPVDDPTSDRNIWCCIRRIVPNILKMTRSQGGGQFQSDLTYISVNTTVPSSKLELQSRLREATTLTTNIQHHVQTSKTGGDSKSHAIQHVCVLDLQLISKRIVIPSNSVVHNTLVLQRSRSIMNCSILGPSDQVRNMNFLWP